MIKQNRSGLPPSLTEEPRFFQMRGTGKDETPAGWNDPKNWKELDDIPEGQPFGFVAGTGSNYLLIDGDHVFDDAGQWVDPFFKTVFSRIWAAGVTYYEKSLSGRGFHLVCDLGDFAESFDPVNNTADEIIMLMSPDEYRALTKEEREKTPKIELFYHINGRYLYLTGNNKEVNEVAKDEAAAAIFRECLTIREECRQRYGKKEEPVKRAAGAVQGEVLDALQYISAADYDTWVHVGIALYRSGFDYSVWDAWSQWRDQRAGVKYDGYSQDETESKWKSFSRSASKWNVGTIYNLAKAGGWRQQQELAYITADSLLKMDIPPVEFLVPGLLVSIGLTGIVAKPKIGKSWLSLDLGVSVASGGDFLGRKCQQADVLYLSLEDSFSRLQNRLEKVLQGRSVPSGLALAIQSKTLDNGLIDDLQGHLKARPNTKLIIIDTLQKVRGQQKRAETLYAYDSRELGLLKGFADKNGISVVLIHHTRKGEDVSDPFQDVSGSQGIFGILDTCIILTKQKRTDKTAKLWTIGRDVDMETYEMEFTSYRWRMLGRSDDVEEQRELDEFKNNPIVTTIEKLLDQGGGKWSGTTSELMQAGRYISGRSIATNETMLGKKLSSMAENFYRYAAIEYETVKAVKNGNKTHRFARMFL